jgi:hypothetical protein
MNFPAEHEISNLPEDTSKFKHFVGYISVRRQYAETGPSSLL